MASTRGQEMINEKKRSIILDFCEILDTYMSSGS